MLNQNGLIGYFWEGNKHTGPGRFTNQDLFKLNGAVAALDAEYWGRALKLTDVLEVLPAQKRNDWFESIQNCKTPPFERESVYLTLDSLMSNRYMYLSEKVDGIYRGLSRDHATNDPQGFSKRMVLKFMVDRYGYIEHRRVEYIQDLRQVIARIEGREFPQNISTFQDLSNGCRKTEFGKWVELDGGEIRIKLHRIGTAHLEIREDIAIKLNQILALLRPNVIARPRNGKQ